jgi:hypothetical protein
MGAHFLATIASAAKVPRFADYDAAKMCVIRCWSVVFTAQYKASSDKNMQKKLSVRFVCFFIFRTLYYDDAAILILHI